VRIFFPETLDYMTKTLNQIIFFPPPQSEYFFQQHWESEYFFIVCLYQFHTIQTPIKQQHFIYVPIRLTLSVFIHNTKPLFLKYAQQNIFLVVHFVPPKTPHSLARWYITGDENFISSVTLRSYNIQGMPV
jgi:hypothetical protein